MEGPLPANKEYIHVFCHDGCEIGLIEENGCTYNYIALFLYVKCVFFLQGSVTPTLLLMRVDTISGHLSVSTSVHFKGAWNSILPQKYSILLFSFFLTFSHSRNKFKSESYSYNVVGDVTDKANKMRLKN